MTELAEIDAPEDLKAIADNCRAPVETRIATVEQFALVTDRIKTVKAALKRADEFFDPPIAQAFSLHKLLCQRKRVITDPLTQSEKIDKARLLDYTQEQAAKAEIERRKAQAIVDEQARRERERIEAQAAKQRAIEAEARAKAEAARREAEAANEEDRKRHLEIARAAERKAAAAAAKADVKEEASAAVVAPVIAVASAAPKITGVSFRKSWKAEVVDLPAFLEFACRNMRTDLILANDAVLQALAKGLREAASIPGVKFAPVETLSARSQP